MYKKFTIFFCTPPGYIQKILLIMKLTTVLLVATLLQVSAAGLAQKVTFVKKEATLKQVFNEVYKQTGYSIFWSGTKARNSIQVNANFKDSSLDAVLKKSLENQPLDYTIENRMIVIREKLPSFLDNVIELFNAEDFNGRVVDEKGVPIAGASVYIKGKQKAAVTDQNGRFTLRGIAEKDIIVVSFIGYLTKQVPFSDKMSEIVLQIGSSKLDEVRVIGYGSDSRRFSTGSVATIDASDIERQPIANPLLALQGQVPGLIITPSSGAPGAGIRVQIRGQSTLQQTTFAITRPYDQPLFIIDGVPFAPQNQNINLGQSVATQTFSPNSGLSAFNSINPQDIESISVLKDADATSIYGSQGANGVILITTKRGKPGVTNVKFSVNSGFNVPAEQVEMLNTQQYLELRKTALINDGVNLAAADPAKSYPDLLVFDQNKYTNWAEYFFDRTTHNTDAHASVSGGTISSNYYISGGLTHQDYNFPGDFADNRLSLHSTFHQSGFDNKLSIDLGTDFSYDHNNSSAAPGITSAFLLPPNTPDLTDASGNLIWNYKGVDISNYSLNQISYLKTPSDLQSFNLNNSLRIAYRITDDLKFNINSGYSRFTTNEKQQFPLAAQAPGNAFVRAVFSDNSFQTINIEPQLDYNHQFGKGKLSVLIGGTYKKSLNASNSITASGYSNDSFLNSLAAATSLTANDAVNTYKYTGGFARINYIYDQKYIINLTGRRDGSSNFGPGKQFGNFGSLGLGWIFTQESLFKSIPFLTYGKLSANYGTSGSDGIAPYQYQSYWKPVSGVSFQGIAPYQPSNPYNPDYSWATKKSLNIALDLGFFSNRLLLNTNIYQTRTGDQLVNYTLPTQTGFSSVVKNTDALVQNRGIEFTLTSNNIKNKGFSWSTGFNISANRNKLLAFPGLAGSAYANIYTIGQSLTTVNGVQYKGVNPTTGVYEFYKADGSTTYTPNTTIAASGGDYVPIADLQPKFSGGLSNNISYGNFNLFFMLQFAKQTGKNYLALAYQAGAIPGTLNNVPVALIEDYWKKPGDIAKVEKPTSQSSDAYRGTYYYPFSSAAYSDASYIRLKTVTLTYKLPEKFIQKINIKSCSFYLSAQNLLTFSPYEIGDPEVPGSLFSFPLQRTIVCGLSFNF